MKIISASTEIINSSVNTLSFLENVGRTCYKTESKGSPEEFVRNLIKRKHFAILEHVSFSVQFIVDRGVSHELVRHRIGSFAQESTRYCNYSKERFGSELTFIRPYFFSETSIKYSEWYDCMKQAEECYLKLLFLGAKPEEARSVLPNSIKTEVIVTFNLREWRHFFELRALGTTGKPHPQMLEVAVPLLRKVQLMFPVVFEDLVIPNAEV